MPKKLLIRISEQMNNVGKVMGDVILALFPCILVTFPAYGIRPLLLCTVCVLSTVLAEWLFSMFFLKKKNSVNDLSAVVTGILLSFTLAPFTPLYIAAFGGAAAVIFGKIAVGGLGRNIFNPALLGREFMTVFFPAAMGSGMIWGNESLLKYKYIEIIKSSEPGSWAEYLDRIFFTCKRCHRRVLDISACCRGNLSYIQGKNNMAYSVFHVYSDIFRDNGFYIFGI